METLYEVEKIFECYYDKVQDDIDKFFYRLRQIKISYNDEIGNIDDPKVFTTNNYIKLREYILEGNELREEAEKFKLQIERGKSNGITPYAGVGLSEEVIRERLTNNGTAKLLDGHRNIFIERMDMVLEEIEFLQNVLSAADIRFKGNIFQ